MDLISKKTGTFIKPRATIDTLDYLKERYSEEQARFNHIEVKCSKFLTFLTAIIGGLSVVAGYSKSTLLSPTSVLEWIRFSFFICASFFVICAWGHSLLALKIDNCPALPKSKETAMYLKGAEMEAREEHIFNCYVDTICELSDVINEKAMVLEHAYSELTYSAWSLGSLGLLAIGMEIVK